MTALRNGGPEPLRRTFKFDVVGSVTAASVEVIRSVARQGVPGTGFEHELWTSGRLEVHCPPVTGRWMCIVVSSAADSGVRIYCRSVCYTSNRCFANAHCTDTVNKNQNHSSLKIGKLAFFIARKKYNFGHNFLSYFPFP